jgi:hypothetical protein
MTVLERLFWSTACWMTLLFLRRLRRRNVCRPNGFRPEDAERKIFKKSNKFEMKKDFFKMESENEATSAEE